MADNYRKSESLKPKTFCKNCSKCGKEVKYLSSEIPRKMFNYCPQCNAIASTAFGVSYFSYMKYRIDYSEKFELNMNKTQLVWI